MQRLAAWVPAGLGLANVATAKGTLPALHSAHSAAVVRPNGWLSSEGRVIFAVALIVAMTLRFRRAQ